MCYMIGFFLVTYILYRLYQYLNPSPEISPNGKYVLISGCDTGFGNGLAIELDCKGYNVLAGIYNADNFGSLTQQLSSRATVFKLDITKQKDIENAYEMVTSKTSSLHALVNNAGIATCGFIDWITLDSMRQVMDVNFFGHVAMTKKFLPLLIRKCDSRVVNVCSAAGYITAPSMSAYSASKYALESFSDCLRREMAVWNLRVCIIEPGFMKTPIIQGHDKALNTLWNTLSNDVKDRWGREHLDKQAKEVSSNLLVRFAENPRKVVQALQHAVTNTKPQIRYRPGWQSSIMGVTISRLPAWIADFIISQTDRASSFTPAGVRDQLKA